MDVYVLSKNLDKLGCTDVVTEGIWTECFSSCGTFEFWAPLDDLHAELFVDGNVLWINDHETAGIIEVVERNGEDEYAKLHITGRHAKCYLDRRTVYPKFDMTGFPSDIARALVNQNCISPADVNRKIPLLSLESNAAQYGSSTTLQQEGESLLDVEVKLIESCGLGSVVAVDPIAKSMVYKVKQGTDRTIDQTSVLPVLISTELDDILASAYSKDLSEYRNMAYVAGEVPETGSQTVVQIGSSITGFDRRETYVDASGTSKSKSETEQYTDAEYQALLAQEGNEKLNDYKVIESFSAVIRTFGNSSYKYGVDFFLGDTVTVYDARLKVRANAKITSAEYTFRNTGNELALTFGYNRLTIMDKLKRSS